MRKRRKMHYTGSINKCVCVSECVCESHRECRREENRLMSMIISGWRDYLLMFSIIPRINLYYFYNQEKMDFLKRKQGIWKETSS